MRGLPRPVKQDHGPEIIAIIQKALTHADGPPADDQVEDDSEFDRNAHKSRINSLWQMIESKARERGIDPAIVASKKDVGRLVRAQALGARINASDHRLLRGWRRELVGRLVD